MPNRILRDGILSSEQVCSLPWPSEVFYRRLMSVVDDHGRFHATPKLLRSNLYPLQIDKVSDADIGKWLTQVVEAGLVSVYPAADGKRYVQILKFGQQIRSKSKFPDPLIHNEPVDNTCNQLLSTAHLDVFVSEGVSVSDNPPTPQGGLRFDEFWASWPAGERKQDKAKCKAKWEKERLDEVADAILLDITTKRQTKKWQEGYIEAPLVYLNNRRWEDGALPQNSDAVGVAKPWWETGPGIRDKGIELGVGDWDEGAEQWFPYRNRVFASASKCGQLPEGFQP